MKKQNNRPPILAEKFFEWYCDNAAIEDLHGDLDELFYANLERMSVTRARFDFPTIGGTVAFTQVKALLFRWRRNLSRRFLWLWFLFWTDLWIL